MGEVRLCSAAFSSMTQSWSAGQCSCSSRGWHQIAAEQSALHVPFTWLWPLFGCRKPARNIPHLLTSAASKPPSLVSCADLPVNPQCWRPSHAAICPLTSFSLQHCSGAQEMLLQGTTYFAIFFPTDTAQKWQAGISLFPLCLSSQFLLRRCLLDSG